MLPHALAAMRAGDHPHGNSGSEATGLRSSDLPDRTLESGPMRSRIQLQVSNKVITPTCDVWRCGGVAVWRGDGVQCGVTAIGFDYSRLYFSILYYTKRATRIGGAAPHVVLAVNNKKRNHGNNKLTISLYITYN